MPYDPNAKLSTTYRLKDLTPTDKFLLAPNEPQNITHWNNLSRLASILERITKEIGPFKIISGFRTKELQNILSSVGEPTSTGTSFHELGRSVDIYPTTQKLDAFFGKILANQALMKELAELAYKPEQKSVHLSINVPGDVRTTKVLGLTQQGKYARLSTDEITNMMRPYMTAAARLVSTNKMPLILAVAAIGLFLIMKKPRTA